MKDIQGMLRRLDEEVLGHRQNIARSQVEIARLQDTRLTLMGLAEKDVAEHEQAAMERGHVINGASARPELIVRKVGSGDEEDKHAKKLARQKKWREDAKAKRDRKAAGEARDDDAKGLQLGSAVEQMRSRVLTLLQGEGGGLKRVEIGDRLNLPRGEKNRKAMSNAVYSLLKRGKLAQDYAGRFKLS